MEKDEKQKILQELGGIGEDIYDELVGDFIAQADLQLRDLNQALSNGDLSAMQSLAHTIKGSSGNLRLYTISAIAKDLEFLSKGNADKAKLNNLLEDLSAALEKLKEK